MRSTKERGAHNGGEGLTCGRRIRPHIPCAEECQGGVGKGAGHSRTAARLPRGRVGRGGEYFLLALQGRYRSRVLNMGRRHFAERVQHRFEEAGRFTVAYDHHTVQQYIRSLAGGLRCK
jgi:hypothetical protein